jgi:16S rRNA (guanine966-N2)-methyltransferase
MRIIAGNAKGLPLAVPRGGNVRPTSDRVREAIFSSLGNRVVGATVLDLYAGSGALGLEAASRGARSVTFVENSGPVLRCLSDNLAAFRRNREVGCEFTVVRGEVIAQLRKLTGQVFTLILADPSYGDTAQILVQNEHLPVLLNTDGLLVLESAKRDQLVVPAGWTVHRDAVYGDTRVSFLRRRPTVD